MNSLATISLPSAGLTALTVAFVGAGCVVAVFGLYLAVLSVAAFFYSEPRPGTAPSSRLAVLIPAHNEAAVLGRCVQSLRAQTYPRDLYEIVVVADNCTDDTAGVAGRAGVHRVIVRDEPDARGKGRALRWAMDRLLWEEPAPAAVVVVDADSIAGPDLLTALARRFEAGAQAVQGEYLLVGDGTAGSELRVSAFLLVNRVRPTGRAVLGLSAHLVGNGMLLSRDLLRERPWDAFTSAEDLEYSLELRRHGVNIVFAADAVVRSPTAPNPRAAAQQQLRWEGGKAHLARTWLRGLVASAFRERRPALLELALALAVPPLGFLAAAIVGGALLGVGLGAVGAVPRWALAPWLVGGLATLFHVLVGLRAGHAPRAGYRALVRAPLLIATKPGRAYRVLTFRGDTWVRTERAAEQDTRGEV
jgi:1,2-diacylglycerol 3-beta-glucosyltransferase